MKKRERAVDLLLDSGAFSAWKKGEELSVRDYIAYIKEHQDLLDSYVCLDVIPGSMGRMDRSQSEIEKSAKASYRNQQVMRDAGLSPIPVFHQGERYEWLERYLADGEGYVGLSPYLRSSQDEIIKWLDVCFSILAGADGKPSVMTHGFGATGARIVARYPWRSVDSTTWAITSSYGVIKLPRERADGSWDYLSKPLLVYTGYGAKPADFAAAWSLDGMSSEKLARVEAFAQACGLTLVELHNSQYARTLAQVFYLQEMEKQKRQFKDISLTSAASFYKSRPKQARDEGFEFKLVFATMTRFGYQATILTQRAAKSRLMSYFELRQESDQRARLEEYVGNGVLNGPRDFLQISAPAQKWGSEHYKDFRRRGFAARALGGGDEQEAAD